MKRNYGLTRKKLLATALSVAMLVPVASGATLSYADFPTSTVTQATPDNSVEVSNPQDFLSTVNTTDKSIIVINGSITLLNQVSSLSDGKLNIKRPLTIIGKTEDSSLTIGRDAKLLLSADVTFKNMRLNGNGEGGLTSSWSIYVGGHTLTLDNVNTKYGNNPGNQNRPTIYGGAYDDTQIVGAKSIINLLNPNNKDEFKIEDIYGGSDKGDTSYPVEINLGKNAEVLGGVYFAGKGHKTKTVTVTSRTKDVRKYDGYNSETSTLKFENESPVYKFNVWAIVDDVQYLELEYTDLQVYQGTIGIGDKNIGHLKMKKSSINMTQFEDFVVESVDGDHVQEEDSKIKIATYGKMKVNGNISGNLDIYPTPVENIEHQYVEAPNTSNNFTMKINSRPYDINKVPEQKYTFEAFIDTNKDNISTNDDTEQQIVFRFQELSQADVDELKDLTPDKLIEKIKSKKESDIFESFINRLVFTNPDRVLVDGDYVSVPLLEVGRVVIDGNVPPEIPFIVETTDKEQTVSYTLPAKDGYKYVKADGSEVKAGEKIVVSGDDRFATIDIKLEKLTDLENGQTQGNGQLEQELPQEGGQSNSTSDAQLKPNHPTSNSSNEQPQENGKPEQGQPQEDGQSNSTSDLQPKLNHSIIDSPNRPSSGGGGGSSSSSGKKVEPSKQEQKSTESKTKDTNKDTKATDIKTSDTAIPKSESNIYIPVVTKTFEDITKHWAKDAIEKVASLNILEGKTDTKFSPNEKITRSILFDVMYRISGELKNTDVISDMTRSDAQKWIIEKGISDGTNANKNVTRQDLISMLYRYSNNKDGKISITKFKDSKKVSTYAQDAMSWAVGNGIIIGKGNNTLEPKANVTKAELSIIIIRYLELLEKKLLEKNK